MAEMVLAHLAEGDLLDLSVSSAGTGPWHEGEPMDPRAAQALRGAGFADRGHLAHQIAAAALGGYDLIVALDRRHRQTLVSLAHPQLIEDRLSLLRSFDPQSGGAVDIADPYYGEQSDFDRCLATIEAGCRGLFEQLRDGQLSGVSPVTPTSPD